MRVLQGFKISARIWALCIAGSAALFALPAQADDGMQTMTYEVYAGGIHGLQATLVVDLTKKERYDIDLAAKTRGFLGSLVPWEGTFESHGWRTADGFMPEIHKSSATWRDEPDIKEYIYGHDGSFKKLTVTDEKVTDHVEDVDDALTQGTTDALTSTLLVMKAVSDGNPCAGETEVFDGARRFKMVFKDKGVSDIKASRYNIFSGLASECEVEVVPMEGKWHSKPRGWLSIQEQGRDRGMMPTVWMAKLNDTGPAVPVKIRVKTAYGALFMHLGAYESGETLRVAESRPEEESAE